MFIVKHNSLIHKSKHGSKISWFFHPGLKVSISVGVLSAVGIIFGIKSGKLINFRSPDQELASPRLWAVPGLENLGNNCFLNVVLQALASCSSFRKYLSNMVEEYGSLSVEEGDENIPLVNSLTSLVEELCTLEHKRTVLSPRKLMIAMDHYIPNFNLATQQDAEEAFSHLLSLLREEISENCVPNKSYLADLPTLANGRILGTKKSEEESVCQRWRRNYLKPFDGIIGSILICQSCSFQISLDFQMFHSLHLSPPTNGDATIMSGCTLKDCLKRFFVAEHLENYCCSNCWHNAAIEYVSAFSENTSDVEKLQSCNKNDSCDCKTLSSLEAFPWSNRFSRTFKQLSIARSPKILCIHLQRASYDMFGESIKLRGHVSFPSILDLSPFMNTGVGIKRMEANLQFGPLNRISREIRSLPFSNYRNMLLDPEMLNRDASSVESIVSETKVVNEQESNDIILQNGPCSRALEVVNEQERNDIILQNDPCSGTSEVVDEQERNDIILQNGPCSGASEAGPSQLDSRTRDDNADVIISPSTPSRHQIYRLVSVVEHFGSGKSGHYTVYRRVTARLGHEEPLALLESAVEQWFSISDSQVHSVSEKEVLDANASMLFYEKIDDS